MHANHNLVQKQLETASTESYFYLDFSMKEEKKYINSNIRQLLEKLQLFRE